MNLRLLGDYVVYLLVRVLICIIQAMRIETCHAMARGLAYLACDILKLRRDVSEENLSHAFPEWSAEKRLDVTRRMWEHLVLMICEVAHMPRKMHETNWRSYVRTKDVEPAVASLLTAKPNVVLLGHFGNFEVGGVLSGLLGFPTHTIARPLDNPFLDRFLAQFRGRTGQYILPKDGSAPAVSALMERGGTLALLGDQNAGPKGCWIEFFGRPASCHKAIALFSLTADAPMIVSYTKRLDRPMRFEFGVTAVYDPERENHSMGDVRSITQWYSEELEKIIRQSPEQYWWIHRRWKDTRGKRKKKIAAKQAARARAA